MTGTGRMTRPKIMILASHYRADHAEKIRPYHSPNKAASTWNTALFAELRQLDIDLHIVQFYPVTRPHVLKDENVTYYYLPRVPKIDGFTSFFKRVRTRWLAKKIRPDLVHGIGSEHGHAWAAVHREWPSIITIHGYLRIINRLAGHRNFLRTIFLAREERNALRRASCVIAINGYMKQLFEQDGYAGRDIRIIHNAVNPVFLRPCLDDCRARDIDILMVGTLHPLKNQHIALQIFSRLTARRRGKLSCLIAGSPTAASDSYYRNLLQFKNENRLENVVFAGGIDPEGLKRIYCKSKILLHISEFETDSMAVSEALSCGVVPVVNPVAGLAYRIKEGVNGYHINIQDIQQASERLSALLDRYDEIKGAADRGRQEIILERHPRAVARLTYKTYLSVLKTAEVQS